MNAMERRRRLACILVFVAVSMAISPSHAQAPDAAACADGVDNDADGAADWPSDANCQSAVDESEDGPPPACWDGVDNDGDGRVDYPRDTECASPYDENEDADELPALGIVDVDLYPRGQLSRMPTGGPCAADVCLDWFILMTGGHVVEMLVSLDTPCGDHSFMRRVTTEGVHAQVIGRLSLDYCGTGTAIVYVFVDGWLYAVDFTTY